MPQGEDGNAACKRTILLLSNGWGSDTDGIPGVNKSLALSFASFAGIRVINAVFTEPSPAEQQEAARLNVTLVNLIVPGITLNDLYTRFTETPEEFTRELVERFPCVNQIVGHAPVTARAAVRLRDTVYTDAKVVLFYHCIPGDVDWIEEKLPFVIPTDTELVRLAEEADIVYSVTEKMHWYFTAKFRNRATCPIDHRLFLPQCPPTVFTIPLSNDSLRAEILVVGAPDDWVGLDIAACAVNKAARVSVQTSQTRPLPSLVVGCSSRKEVSAAKNCVDNYMEEKVKVDYHDYETESESVLKDLSKATLCLIPSRAEPLGNEGLHALSAGVPTLISEASCLVPLIRRLAHEPDHFIVPVTASAGSVRQDASLWRDRILAVLADIQGARERALQLSTALRRDEVTKETHDNFISNCLGGIKLKHEVTALHFLYRKESEKEVPVTKAFNTFLCALMKQCWRLKHHPLTTENDLVQLIPCDLPVRHLLKHVTDKIEEYDRRIVGVDDESFIVYCPTADALSDLWAMCDRINKALTDDLLGEDENEVLPYFRLDTVSLRTVISGPAFLQYKQQLVTATSLS